MGAAEGGGEDGFAGFLMFADDGGEVVIADAFDVVARSGGVGVLSSVVVLDFGCGFAQESGMGKMGSGSFGDADGFLEELQLGFAPGS